MNEYGQEKRFAAEWKAVNGFTFQNAFPIFAQMRARKSPMELQLLQHAIDITTEAHERACSPNSSRMHHYSEFASAEGFKRLCEGS